MRDEESLRRKAPVQHSDEETDDFRVDDTCMGVLAAAVRNVVFRSYIAPDSPEGIKL